MPILLVNSGRKGRRGIRVKGRARVGKAKRRARKPLQRTVMAKKKRKKASKGRRKHSSSPKRRKRRVKRAATPKRRKRRAHKSAPKRRRKRRVHKTTKRRRKRKAHKTTKRRRKRRAHKSAPRRKRRKARKSHRKTRRRKSKAQAVTIVMRRGPTGTLKSNPSRRRKRRKGRKSYRRLHKRYGKRRYKKNPGGILGMLKGIVKEALPVLAGLYGTRVLVSQVSGIGAVSSLGTAKGPVLAVGALIGMHFATDKIGALKKHRSSLMIGAALNALDSLVQAFAPASVKSMIGMSGGMGDYVQLGDYLSVGATPINDDVTMGDYVAVGSDGVEQELGMGGVEEELGAVEEELGNDLLGGVSQGSMLMNVPNRPMLAAVPARSFTKMVPAAGPGYDQGLYRGIFAG